MESLTITDNLVETLRIIDDGERYFLTHKNKTRELKIAIILNSREALVLEKWLELRRKG